MSSQTGIGIQLLVALLLVASVIAAGRAMADEPSFDCGKAEGAVEEMVCKDTQLAELDRRLAEVYAAAARQALLRITNDIRTAYDAGAVPTNDPDESYLTLYENADLDVRCIYHFNSTEQALYMDLVDDGKDPFLLCKNVTTMTFKRSPSHADADKIGSVRIIMTLTDDRGEVSQTLAAASVIRKNL